MKRFLLVIFTLALLIFIVFAFLVLWNRNYYCDPRGKTWYNRTSLPSISRPYKELYDGSYTINIDREGNVLFKPLEGDEIKGKMIVYPDEKYKEARITIEFENGITSHGECRKNKNGRSLYFEYMSSYYNFSEERGIFKEASEEYRAGLIEFLYGIYETGEFPTEQEIEENELYMNYTNYHQVDPGHGGPVIYDLVDKATVEEIDFENKLITLTVNGETYQVIFGEETQVSYVSDGKIVEMGIEDLATGECLVVHFNSVFLNHIYYLENK